jgi:hypothetical protein
MSVDHQDCLWSEFSSNFGFKPCFSLSLNMSNSKRFFVCLILSLSLLLPKSTSAQIVDQRDDMNWTFFMAVTWTVESIQDLNFNFWASKLKYNFEPDQKWPSTQIIKAVIKIRKLLISYVKNQLDPSAQDFYLMISTCFTVFDCCILAQL